MTIQMILLRYIRICIMYTVNLWIIQRISALKMKRCREAVFLPLKADNTFNIENKLLQIKQLRERKQKAGQWNLHIVNQTDW